MTVTPEMVRTAARVLQISETEAREHCLEVPGHPVGRFWSPIRGGGAVIVGSDLSYLKVTGQTIGPLEAIDAYLAGARTQDPPTVEAVQG